MQKIEKHRSLRDPILFLFNHEFGPYLNILSGNIPSEWRVENIPIDILRADVKNQLTLLLAGDEYLRKKSPLEYHFGKKPLYSDMLKKIEEITEYRDKEKERFDAEVEEVVTRTRRS